MGWIQRRVIWGYLGLYALAALLIFAGVRVSDGLALAGFWLLAGNFVAGTAILVVVCVKRVRSEAVRLIPARARLLHPDFGAMEARLERPLPRALKDFWAVPAALERADVAVRRPGEEGVLVEIGCFYPMDGEQAGYLLGLLADGVLSRPLLAIAEVAGRGDLVVIDLEGGDDPPVYELIHDRPDDPRLLADRLSEFLAWAAPESGGGS